MSVKRLVVMKSEMHPHPQLLESFYRDVSDSLQAFAFVEDHEHDLGVECLGYLECETPGLRFFFVGGAFGKRAVACEGKRE